MSVNVTVESVSHNGEWWNTTTCPKDPAVAMEYQSSSWSNLLDVKKLVDVAYAPNPNWNGNPNINNHKFWFQFGGLTAAEPHCVDDNDKTHTYTDNFWNMTCLKLEGYHPEYEVGIWIDFLTQCEDCIGNFQSSIGNWYKWERLYMPGELTGNSNICPSNVEAELGFLASVSCSPFDIYGCQFGELR